MRWMRHMMQEVELASCSCGCCSSSYAHSGCPDESSMLTLGRRMSCTRGSCVS